MTGVKEINYCVTRIKKKMKSQRVSFSWIIFISFSDPAGTNEMPRGFEIFIYTRIRMYPICRIVYVDTLAKFCSIYTDTPQNSISLNLRVE